MRILFWQWSAFMQKGMENALKRMNIYYDVFYYVVGDWEKDDGFVKDLRKKLAEETYDIVLSVNYNPLISGVCEEINRKGNNIRYISWVYDSPVHIRNKESFNNACNRIYFFDRGQKEAYEACGYKNVFYMPLAADPDVWSLEENDKYKCDVAFVGKMYRTDYDYLLSPLPQYERGLLDGFVSAQGQINGGYILEELITDEVVGRLNEYYLKASGGKYTVKRDELLYNCACEVTGRERFMALSLLAGRCKLKIFTGDKNVGIKDAQIGGYVDYYSRMPQVFHNAAINLNISLKTIRTGIPLRVIDVLGCGGFLITNCQEEIFEYFTPGEDLVVYEDMEDLVLKVSYYLSHEEERKRIADNGRRKVKDYFTFDDRLEKMFGGLA